MVIRFLSAGLCLALLSGCASVYRGGYPNYKSSEREQELRKFTMTEGFWRQSPAIMTMNDVAYTRESIEPLLLEVSPRAIRRIEKAKTWRLVQLLALIPSAAILAATWGSDQGFSRDQSLAVWSGIGLSWGAGFASAFQMNRAAIEYNEDLRMKFAPAVSFNFEY